LQQWLWLRRVSRVSPFHAKVAIVTGGASGIARALCEGLAQRGAVMIVADVNGEAASEVATHLAKRGATARGVQLDVVNFDQVERIVQETSAAHGRLDFMFNNAGIAVVGELRDTTPEHWRKVLDVNLMGVIHGTLAAYAAMIPQGHGHIINVSSVTGLMPTPVLAPYGTPSGRS
jgi:NAD(P)-dependent dehydrogenase (short-subunit alcohol dehydrogenase family)